MTETATALAKEKTIQVYVPYWNKALGIKLRKAREQHGYSAEQFATLIGIDNIFLYQRVEKGKKKPTNEQCGRIMARLGLTPEALFGPEWTKFVVKAETPEDDDKAPEGTEAPEATTDPAAPEATTDSASEPTEEEKPQTIASRFREARLKSGLTCAQVVSRIGITKQTLRNYETGKTMPPREAVLKLAKVYGMNAYDLVPKAAYIKLRKTYDKKPTDAPVKADAEEPMAGPAAEIAVEQVSDVPDSPATAETADDRAGLPEKAEPAAVIPEGIVTVPVIREISVPLPETPDGTPAWTTDDEAKPFSEETRRMGECLAFKRRMMRLDEADVADAAGITPEKYRAIERGTADITLTQFTRLAKVLKLVPENAAKEVFACKWRDFYKDQPKDFYTLLGACVDHQIPYEISENYSSISVYAPSDILKTLVKTLEIKGSFCPSLEET